MTPLPFTAPALLAPMEGITEPAFRRVMMKLHEPSNLGGAFTDFLRVTHYAVTRQQVKAHLDDQSFAMPLGLQLMGGDADRVAESAAIAAQAGARLIDLNFGCPSKGALRGCAGSALLDDLHAMERMVSVCREVLPDTVPVTAKIRAGLDTDAGLEDMVRAVECGGADMLTLHCRTRDEAYCDHVDWTRIRRAVEVTSVPVCGNGGVESHEDIGRMMRETGCSYVMVGRGALKDPWVFSGHAASRGGVRDFLLEYLDGLCLHPRAGERGVVGRLKQLIRYWAAAGFPGDLKAMFMKVESIEEMRELILSFAQADSAAGSTHGC